MIQFYVALFVIVLTSLLVYTTLHGSQKFADQIISTPKPTVASMSITRSDRKSEKTGSPYRYAEIEKQMDRRNSILQLGRPDIHGTPGSTRPESGRQIYTLFYMVSC